MPDHDPAENNNIRTFPSSVIEDIKFYVYVLRDPRDGEVFYVGKGKGNCVFAHVGEALESPTSSDKLDRIRAIHEAGEQVGYEIIRHGMDEGHAFAVESALIDWIGRDRLSNAVAGHHADRQGRMTITDIIATDRAEPVTIQAPCILVIVNRLFARNTDPARLYEITRGDWVIGKRREAAKYAMAVFRGVIRAVYSINAWQAVLSKGDGQRRHSRWRFVGNPALELQHLVGGDVTTYLGKASQNPIRYVNC